MQNVGEIYDRSECQCVPWKYPQLGNTSELCDFLGNICFKKLMDENVRILNCDCRPDCSKVSFDYYVVREDLNPSVECNKTEENAYLLDYLKNYQVLISSTFYEQLLQVQIPKVQKKLMS